AAGWRQFHGLAGKCGKCDGRRLLVQCVTKQRYHLSEPGRTTHVQAVRHLQLLGTVAPFSRNRYKAGMDLLRLIMRDYRLAFSGVLVASLASAGMGIGVIAFINTRLIEVSADPLPALLQFLGLIALLLAISL